MMRIRKAQHDDLPKMSALLRSTPEAAQWNEAQLASCLNGDDKICFVAVSDESAIAGFVAASRVAGEAELENIAVAQEFRRRGVARLLVNELRDWAAVIHLEVRAGNMAAVAAYCSFGFVQDGVRRGYYSNPDDDAVLMTLR